jgi:hypothetical protein
VSITGCKINEEAAYTRIVRYADITQVRSLEEFLNKARCKWENKIRNLLFGMERIKTNYCKWSNIRWDCLVDDIVLTTGDTRKASCKTLGDSRRNLLCNQTS